MNQCMIFFNDTLDELEYEVRDGQTDMALDIVDAMKDNQHIVIEAGVGIGKSFAYLVPLILYNKQFNEPIVIATSSIALQEQLIGDIREISNHLGISPNVVLAKGMRNYACLRNCIDTNVPNSQENEGIKELVKIVEGGEIDKAKLPNVSSRTWSSLSAENCKSNNCEIKRDCILIKRRELLKKTHGIIITNQDMLVRNLINRKNYRRQLFNSDIKFVVIDEAHNLEEKVRSAYTNKWTYNSIKKDLYEIKKSIRYNRSEADNIINTLVSLIDDLFSKLNSQIEEQLKKQDIEEGERYFLHSEVIYKEINKINNYLNSYLILVATNSDDRYEFNEEVYGSLNDFLNGMKELLKSDPKWLYWMNRVRNNKYGISIEVCPKGVNSNVRELIFDDYNIKSILTSATITHVKGDSDEESYSYFINNISFPLDPSRGFLSSPKDSPFLYDENAILYTTDRLPLYGSDKVGFIEEGIKEIISLANIIGGKMLVLFTSKKDMNDVYTQMKDMGLPWNIIVQDGNSSQLDILEEFKMDVNSILLGTGAFWEGISIEGEALSCVVIFRLPFPVPDPIIKYKCDNSKDRMKEVLLPYMIIKLKQGIGRLIRNKTDKGIVAILDPRLGKSSNSSYKDIVWESLPIKNKTNELNVIQKFYDKVCK